MGVANRGRHWTHGGGIDKVSVLDAFLSTWSNALATFGHGGPQPGAGYGRSSTLEQLTADLNQAVPDTHWWGGAASAYGAVNTRHRRVVGGLGNLDIRLVEQIDQSASIIAGGRRDLNALRQWVVDAAAGLPKSEAGERMLLPIVRTGLIHLTDIVTRANADLSSVGGNIRTIGDEYQELGDGQEVGVTDEDAFEASGDAAQADADRKKNQAEAFCEVFGRDPVSGSDWITAAALDPHSYDPKNQGVEADIVVGRINPVPGQGVVRTNLFIPGDDVVVPRFFPPSYDVDLGDNRGFSPTAGPEDSRVAIYTDFDNGIIVARQNPSINVDTGEIRTGSASIGAVQRSDGSVLIRYNAANPFSPGGEGPSKALGISVNGTLGIVPSETGIRVGGDDVSMFPALEIYSDRAGTTTPLLDFWPWFADNPVFGPTGLLHDSFIGDPTVVPSFDSLVPPIGQLMPPALHDSGTFPLTLPMSIAPPDNFTPFGPATDAPKVLVYTPLRGDDYLVHPRPKG